MNHVPVCTARDLSAGVSGRALISLAAGLALCVLASGPVMAQSETGFSDLPGAGSADASAEVDPFPFDARLAIRRYINNTLPSLWWANEPEQSLGTFSVMIHVPDDWRGNPTSALMQFCPPAHSQLWQRLSQIELVPFYKRARWSSTICRK